jgi:hypothetical protein
LSATRISVGAGLAHQVDERGQHLGVGGGAQHGGALEGDVGLDDHDVAALDEAADAADGVHGARTSAGTRAPGPRPGGAASPRRHRVAALRQAQGRVTGLPRSPSGSLSDSGQRAGARLT